MGFPTTPRVVGRGGTATRCEGLPLGEPAQARRVTTMWQSQPNSLKQERIFPFLFFCVNEMSGVGTTIGRPYGETHLLRTNVDIIEKHREGQDPPLQ